MANITTILNAKYPRRLIRPGCQADDALKRAWDCVQAAVKRPAVSHTVTCNATLPRAAVLSDQVAFLNIFDPCDPFLAVAPSQLKGPEGGFKIGGEIELSFTSCPFNDAELEVMNETIPLFEFLFGDTQFFVKPPTEKIPLQEWSLGMRAEDALSYGLVYHSLTLQEISRLDLSEDALICEPACSTGELIRKINHRFPQFEITGSDLNPTAVAIARRRNPDVRILQAGAQDFGYLDIGSVSLFVFSGLLSHGVVTMEEAEQILGQAAICSQDYGYMIITGKSVPLFDFGDLGRRGFYPVLSTKWQDFTFYPFYVCITPRIVQTSEDSYRAVPIWEELENEGSTKL